MLKVLTPPSAPPLPSWATPLSLPAPSSPPSPVTLPPMIALLLYMRRITIDNDTHSDLERASKLTGLNEREFLDRAITHYLHSFRKNVSYTDEFDAWDTASDEALIKMERDL
jgi:hypothetical protein